MPPYTTLPAIRLTHVDSDSLRTTPSPAHKKARFGAAAIDVGLPLKTGAASCVRVESSINIEYGTLRFPIGPLPKTISVRAFDHANSLTSMVEASIEGWEMVTPSEFRMTVAR